MKIHMDEDENSKYDSDIEETKTLFKRTETAKSEEKKILLSDIKDNVKRDNSRVEIADKDSKKGDKYGSEIAGTPGNMFVKEEKVVSKVKQKLRMTTLRRSLSEVKFCDC